MGFLIFGRTVVRNGTFESQRCDKIIARSTENVTQRGLYVIWTKQTKLFTACKSWKVAERLRQVLENASITVL